LNAWKWVVFDFKLIFVLVSKMQLDEVGVEFGASKDELVGFSLGEGGLVLIIVCLNLIN